MGSSSMKMDDFVAYLVIVTETERKKLIGRYYVSINMISFGILAIIIVTLEGYPYV
jgi:hypothetical protein